MSWYMKIEDGAAVGVPVGRPANAIIQTDNGQALVGCGHWSDAQLLELAGWAKVDPALALDPVWHDTPGGGTFDAGTGLATPTIHDKPVGTMRRKAHAMVDTAAETARQAFLTPGAGQAMEYEATRREAAAAEDDPADPLDAAKYPMLEAERLALDAVGQTESLIDIAAGVRLSSEAWSAAGSAIKRVRREAKLKIDAAMTAAEIRAILDAVAWPEPQE